MKWQLRANSRLTTPRPSITPFERRKLLASELRKLRSSVALDAAEKTKALAEADKAQASTWKERVETLRAAAIGFTLVYGIGINDADNGVYLRDIKYPCPKGLEKATIHDHIHSFNYHYNVLSRLLDVADDDAAGGRKQLKTIKGEILTDQFPYRKQL